MATHRTTRSMSKEPQAMQHPPRLTARKAKAKAATLGLVIDLTLTDDEDDVVPVAGPSRFRYDLSRLNRPSGSKTKHTYVLDERGDANDEPRVLVESNDRVDPLRAPRTLSKVLAELQRLEKENDAADVELVDNVAAPVPLQVQPLPFLPGDYLPRMAQPYPVEFDDHPYNPADARLPSPPIVQNDALDGLDQPVPPAQPVHPPEPVYHPVDVDPLARVLEIVPDVEPEHAQKLIDAHIATYGADKVVQPVLHLLFEDPTYPKVQKGKRKASDEVGGSNKKPKIDYGSMDRPFTGGMGYFEAAVTQLTLDYPYISKSELRNIIGRHGNFYAPTFLYIREEEKKPLEQRPYRMKKTASKGKNRAVDPGEEDDELAKEIKWIKERFEGTAGGQAGGDGETEEGSTEAPEGEGVECGCCFGEYLFDTMIQCPDAHLFCISCVRQYASTKLADGHADVPCPSAGEPPCKMLFPESELRRALKDKQMELWYRVRARRDLESAGLDGLEECPFCDYAAVVENPDEKLFHCAREECGEVSCRACKKKDHLPKSCKEADEDNVLDAQHTIEEAMTKALMRNCPKCKKAFVKEAGCNKMTCPYCHTLSCYICRQIIVGYDHFDQTPNGRRRSHAKSGKCALWDDVDKRHHQEVEAAAQRALAEVRATAPEVDANAIKVDIPAAPAAPPAPPAFPQLPPFPHHMAPMMGHGWFGAQAALDRVHAGHNRADQILHNAMNHQADFVHHLPRHMPHPPPLPRLRELDIALQMQVQAVDAQRALMEERVLQRRALEAEAARYAPYVEPPVRAGRRARAARPRWQ